MAAIPLQILAFTFFNNCKVGGSAPAGAFYLGRPWRKYARVVFQKSSLSQVINGAGWSVWNKGDENTSNVTFGEFSNTGPGAGGRRAPFSKKLGSAVSLNQVIPSSGWIDKKWMP